MFAFFVVASFSLFSGVAHAGYCYCANNSGTTTTGSPILDPNRQLFDTITSDTACNDKCFSIKDGTYYYYSSTIDATYAKSDTLFKAAMSKVNNAAATSNAATNAYNAASTVELKKDVDNKSAVCSVGASTVKLDLVEAFKCILYSVLQGLGWIFGIVASLFQWVVDPVNISGGAGMLNKPEVKNVWIMVRDTLNMTFIMVLLFAAFCTVFQVDKWNLKKVWLSILINALLVNFSFPIARIFIDISNVAMYYFLNHLFTGTGGGSGSAIMASFGDQAKLGVLLKADDYAKADMTYLLAAIIFTFILGLTLLVLAVMFVIRLVALTILLMFSPIGFVGFIFPGTSKFASDWWDNLFKNAFFGPIMVFMMMVALTIMKAAPIETFNAAASGNVAASQVNWIAKAAYYSIPIIVLWTAMGISQSMGIAMADKVVGAGKKWGGKAAMFVSGAGKAQNFFKRQKDTFAAARKKRSDEMDKKTIGSRLADKTNDFQDKTFGGEKGKKRLNKRKLTKNREDIKNKSDDNEKATEGTLYTAIDKNIKTPPKTNDEIIEAAGQFKQASSRGSKYEKVVEADIKLNDAAYKDIDTAYLTAKTNAEADHVSATGANEAPKAPTGRSNPVQIAKFQAEHATYLAKQTKLDHDLERELSEMKKKKEFDEKERIAEKKKEHMDKGRELIEKAEAINQLK